MSHIVAVEKPKSRVSALKSLGYVHVWLLVSLNIRTQGCPSVEQVLSQCSLVSAQFAFSNSLPLERFFFCEPFVPTLSHFVCNCASHVPFHAVRYSNISNMLQILNSE